MAAKIGDIVRYLNAVGGGRVTRIEGNMAYVDDEGFETPVLIKECVVVTPASEVPKPSKEKNIIPASKPSPQASATPTPQVTIEEPSEEDTAETDYGDRLNIVLGYEAADIKNLSSTTFDAYLVNDSNYYLYFSYMTRADEAKGWTTRYAGIVEPNIQVWLGEVLREDLQSLDRVCIQYIAFKRDKEFALKTPVSVETKLDTTKFCRLHCFRDNVYFDTPVIAIDIVKDDIPQRAKSVDPRRLEEGIKAKKAIDRERRKPVVKRRQPTDGVLEVDLHIHELVDNTRGLSPADMLNLQVDEFRRVMDSNLKNKGLKIVFIHGKGEGVLRQALMKELNHRYKGHQVQDASFREYGYGATQVTI